MIRRLACRFGYRREPGLTPYCRWCHRCPCGHRSTCLVKWAGYRS